MWPKFITGVNRIPYTGSRIPNCGVHTDRKVVLSMIRAVLLMLSGSDMVAGPAGGLTKLPFGHGDCPWIRT